MHHRNALMQLINKTPFPWDLSVGPSDVATVAEV